jgi:hypothetical protein
MVAIPMRTSLNSAELGFPDWSGPAALLDPDGPELDGPDGVLPPDGCPDDDLEAGATKISICKYTQQRKSVARTIIRAVGCKLGLDIGSTEAAGGCRALRDVVHVDGRRA